MAKISRFTQQAQHSLSLAQEITERMMVRKIGTGHLLIGLLETEGSITQGVLTALGFERQIIENVIAPRYEIAPFAAIDLSKDVKKALEQGEKVANSLGEQMVECEHILLGLTQVNDHETQLACATAGLTVAQVREKTLAAIANRGSMSSEAAPPSQDD